MYISFSNCNLSKLYVQNDIPTPCNVVTNYAQETTLTIEKNNSILVCFDVDNSMVKGHMHNALANRYEPYTSDNGLWVVEKSQIKLQDDRTQANPNYNPDHVKDMTKWFLNHIPIRDQEGLKNLIIKLLNK